MNQTSLVQHGEKEMTLQPASTDTMGMIQRALSDPNFNAENFKTLVDFRDREIARHAEAAFNEAMHAAQAEMRPIEADANNPQTRSRYASYLKLDKALRPIYSKRGFSLSFNTEDSPLADHMRPVCYVSHTGGHTRKYQIDIPTDGKGAKGNDVMTKTHAVGAGASYGMRYLLKMIFNVLVGEDDRDGNEAEPPKPAAPHGFNDFMDNMRAVADEGFTAFSAAWKAAKPQHRTHATNYYKGDMSALRAKAEGVTKAATA